MSVTVNLLYNPTGADHLDKDFIGIIGLTGEMKENTSVIDPVVIIQSNENYMFGYTDENNVYHHGCNYFSIPAFNRYYFLINIVVLETGLYEIHGHVDVLMSFRNDIRKQTAIIRRQETASAYNLYINDNSLKSYQNPHVITKGFNSGFNGFSYILAVAGVKGSEEIHDPPAINDLSITVTQPNLFYSYNLTWTLQTNTEWYDVYRRYYSPTRGFGGWRKINISRITTNSFSKEYYPALSTNYQFAVVSNNAYGTNWSNIVSAPSVPTV